MDFITKCYLVKSVYVASINATHTIIEGSSVGTEDLINQNVYTGMIKHHVDMDVMDKFIPSEFWIKVRWNVFTDSMPHLYLKNCYLCTVGW